MKQLTFLFFLMLFQEHQAQLKVVKTITPIKNLSLGSNTAPRLINNYFYFGASNPAMVSQGTELYKSDSTDAGTVLVKDINPSSFGHSYPSDFTFLSGSNILFTANDGTNGRELWITDGTTNGTNLVKDIMPGSNNGPYEYFTRMGNEVFFMSDDGVNGYELWKSDGTTSGTQMVKNINPSGNGMQMPVSLYRRYTAVLNGYLYFVATDGALGYELYKTDGTTAGTSLVKDIYPGSNSSAPESFMVVNGFLYFTANNGSSGKELWKTDGSSAGTVLVKDFTPLTAASTNPDYLTVLNNKIYFLGLLNSKATLFESDGTTAGTFTVFTAPNFNTTFVRLTKVDTSLYFFDTNVASTNPVYDLYKFSSLNNTSVLIKAGLYGGTGPAYQPTKEKSVALNGMLYFTFENSANGDELWQSDGTSTGTKLITDIGIGTITSWVDHLIPVSNGVNSRVYFTSTQKAGLLYIQADAVNLGSSETYQMWSRYLLFPNPVKEKLYIKSRYGKDDVKEVRVYTASGVLVKNIKSTDYALTELDVQELESGIYVLTLITESGKVSGKLSIQ